MEIRKKLNIAIILITIIVVFTSCLGTGTLKQSQARSGTSARISDPLWTGDGGKEISIAILAPQASGLAENQGYLPLLVQGEFVSNFSSYSAISVLDRVRLDEQYSELLSGYYSDDSQAGMDLGHLTPTAYIMGGNLTKTTTGYAMQMHITKTADKTTAASYSGTFSFAELDNLSGIRQISLDLLKKMGVVPTENAKIELTGAAPANRVNAQTALAQGIIAQRNGNTVETMARFYEAAALDSSIKEAVTRANTMSSNIRTGRLGDNIRNDIAWHDEWKKILEDASKYLRDNPPVFLQVFYDPVPIQGNIDYDKRSAEICFMAKLETPLYPSKYFKLINDLNEGLNATKRNGDWKLKLLTPGKIWNVIDRLNITATLINGDGKVIGNWWIVEGVGFSSLNEFSDQYFSLRTIINPFNHNEFLNLNSLPIIFNVSADNITENMHIRFTASFSASRSVYEKPIHYENSIQFIERTFVPPRTRR